MTHHLSKALLRWPGAVPPRPVEEVTRVSPRERNPASAGLDKSAIDAIWKAVERWYQSGLCPAISLCLRRRGEVVVDRSIGLARNLHDASAQVASPDTLFNVFSASKMIVGVLIHQARQRGEVALDAPVAHYVPEFGVHGKDTITIRDVLAHRSRLPSFDEPTTLDLLNDRPRIVRWLCNARPRLRPGRLAYHALTGGYILAEVLERVTGLSIQALLARDIATPLGLEHFRFGAERRDIERVAENVYAGPQLPAPLSFLFRRSLGITAENATRLSNDPRFLDAVIPAGNLVTSAEQACRFMEALRCGGRYGDVSLLDSALVDEALAEHSHFELDNTLILPVRYGLGFMLGDTLFSPYGRNTKEAFGHLGFMQVMLWSDRSRELSGALLTSGKTILSPGLVHFAGVMQTIAGRIPRA